MATLTTPDDAHVCVCCAVELEDGSRDADEVWRGEGECVVCGQQGCEWHSHNYDTNVVSGWAHESCKENWRAFVPENEPGYGRD